MLYKKGLLLCLMMATFTILNLSSAPVALSQGQGQLKMIIINDASPGQLKKLVDMGLDIAAIRKGPEKEGPRGVSLPSYRVEVVVSAQEAQKLKQDGFRWSDVPGKGPTHKIGSPYDVYHSFDEPITGIKAEVRKIGATYPKLTEVGSVGRTLQGRTIPYIRLTNEKIKGDKPQVLFVATTHAREWISTQVGMRLIKYLLANYGSDARVTNLLDTTEVWVVPVVNPDGYQYTFTNERLWRKNLRDNNGDGQITVGDGVDLNRNFDSHWGYDDEGSSPVPPVETYRGTAPNSEPETQALINFIDGQDFKFILSYHSFSDLILYPWGWQVKTPSLDDPIFLAQAGVDGNSAIFDTLLGAEYDPGVGADLYTTNGEFTDWAYAERDIPAYTVELTFGSDLDGSNYYGFEFPDDEAMVQSVFNDNLEFALSLAESAKDPAHPVSPVGLPAEDAYHTPVTDSYGSDQIVEVLARKGLNLALNYSINDGSNQTAGFSEKLGQYYNDESGVYYSKYEAVISGQAAGDNVSYSVSAGSGVLGPYNYTVTSATGNPILVMAAEDYTGTNPVYADQSQPNYLQYYTDALDAAGYLDQYDIWDVDTQGIPTYAEVLSHYQTVIWYTGDDYAARIPLNLATQEVETLEVRDFFNYENGKLFATGQDFSWLASAAAFYPDDFFQYYLGAYLDLDTAGIDANSGLPFDINGEPGDPILGGLSFSLQGGNGADNQCCSSTFLPTNFFIPHFDTNVVAKYDRPGGPFDPHSGSYYVYSQVADQSYKRLGGTFTLPAGSPTLKFWMSYDTESDWDYAFVEVSQAGSGVWTTLPDMNGFTTTDTGLSCPAGWVDQIHPFLANYMDATCSSTGATGSWNAFTGNSGGWHQVEVDLSAYAGQTVELYISYASDWATQGLGVFVDDIELSGSSLEDFEAGLGQWQVSAGPGNVPFNNWAYIPGTGFPEGPAVRTPNTVYFGFGFEGIATAADRNTVMQRVMQYLGQ